MRDNQSKTPTISLDFLLAYLVYACRFSARTGKEEQRRLAAVGHSRTLLYNLILDRDLNDSVTLSTFGTIDFEFFL